MKVWRVGALHYSINTAAISLPHTAEPRLATQIPQLDGHATLGHFSHVEAYVPSAVSKPKATSGLKRGLRKFSAGAAADAKMRPANALSGSCLR
jgi:hypothetical protein